MIDTNLAAQLREVFAKLENPVNLLYRPSTHPKQGELVAMLEALAEASPHVIVREGGEASEVPQLWLEHGGQRTGARFTGIPGGHEFSSLILAILHADRKGKLPDAALIDRIRRLRGPVRLRTFISLSCENCPDVVQALNLMATLHEDFEHEMVDGEFAPADVAALKIQGVPAVIHDGKLVHSGKSNLGELLSKLEQELGVVEVAGRARTTDLGHYDVAVIGGGPAGAASAIYTARKGFKTVVISDRLGGQLQDTKGIENLISVPYTEGPKLTANLGEHLSQYDIEVVEHRRVARVEPGEPVRLSLDSGETLTTGSLIIATGANWRELGVEGEKEYLGRGVAFCPHCDGPYYKGKDIAVVGGGNSGVEAAIDLAGIAKSVTVLEFMPELKADAVLQAKLDSLPNTRVIKNARTLRVLGDGEKVVALEYEDRGSGRTQELKLAGVFVQIGLVPNSGFLSDIVKTNQYGEILVDDKCRTSQPGIYAAGDVTNVPYKQIVVAIGEGAKAGLAAFEDRMVA
ncbi:MAG: alkyl hydroperoxide reductase subunit F [Polyangiales bacterium]